MDQHTTLIWDQSFADPRYFSGINVLLSFTLSFSSICLLVSKGGCSLICLINHFWHSARSLIHSNLSVGCYKLSSPHHRIGQSLWYCELQAQPTCTIWLFQCFLWGIFLIQGLVNLHYLSVTRWKNASLEYDRQELSCSCVMTLTDKTAVMKIIKLLSK